MNLTETEKQRLIEEVKDKFDSLGLDYQTFDTIAQIDSTLTYSENKEIILQQIKPLIKHEPNMKEIKSINEQWTFIESQQQNSDEILTYDNLSKVKTIAIFGDTGTGKTALAYKIIECFKAKKSIYFMRHPNKRLILSLGYKNLTSLEELEYIKDCVVYIDEPQLITSIYDKKSNNIISKICSLARQRNITLIVSSSDTRVFGKSNEAFFDLWIVKDCDYSMVKNGSKIKSIIKNNCFIDPNGFKLRDDEFLSGSRTLSDFNGRHTFNLINGWNDKLSKPYS